MYRPLLALALLAAALPAAAADLTVAVSGISKDPGEIGCALFASPTGFPMEVEGVTRQYLKADPAGVTCHFQNIAPGRYAIAVAHDRNGNRKPDTNWLGIPTEDWGVSNNIRPSLRAPRFDEAAVTVPAAGLLINVTVAP
jgi:uncharacterized protein (DUF2141 family)